jgi:hypothetical protein
LGTFHTELAEPLLDPKANMVIDGHGITKKLRIFIDQKHFNFNNTTYLITDTEDNLLNENYRSVLGKPNKI